MSFGTPQASKPLFSFGNTTPASSTTTTNTSAPSGFSFGGSSTTNSSSTPGTSTLFGAKPAASNPFGGFGQQQQQGSTTGTPSTSQPFSFGKPAASTTTGTTGSAPAPFGGFKLGQSTATGQTGQAQPFSFGTQSTSTTAPASTGGFSFGQSPPAQQQQQNQPFQLGQTQQQQQPQQGQQQSGLGVTSTGAPITNQTRFEELPQELKSYIESLESHIQGRIAIYDDLKSEKLGSGIHDTSTLLRQLRTEFAALTNNLAHDSRHSQTLQKRYMQTAEDAQKALGTVDAFNAPQGNLNPQQQQQQQQMQQFQFPKPPANFLPDFFRRRTEEMSERLAVYKSSIEQVQSQLGRSDPDSVKAILPTLRSQHQATLQLASKLAALEGAVNELKAEYTHLWRERTNSIRDPFLDRRREILGHDQAITESIGGMSLR